MKKRNLLASSAYHEAGHVVACMCFDIDLTHACASEKKGAVWWYDHAVDSETLTMLYAGLASDIRKHGVSVYAVSSSRSDFKDAFDESTNHSMSKELERAMHLIHEEWPAVERVAKHLMKHGSARKEKLTELFEGP